MATDGVKIVPADPAWREKLEAGAATRAPHHAGPSSAGAARCASEQAAIAAAARAIRAEATTLPTRERAARSRHGSEPGQALRRPSGTDPAKVGDVPEVPVAREEHGVVLEGDGCDP